MIPSKPFWSYGPLHVDFNLTNACNLACVHCHSSSGTKLKNELSKSEVISVIDQLHKLGTRSIAFAGGEPFVRKDIIAILSYACALPGWSISVITNGLFLTPQTVNSIITKCKDLIINVSLDGSTAERMAVLRKQKKAHKNYSSSVFQQVIDGIGRITSAGIRTSVNFTITKSTIDDLLNTYHVVTDELDVDGVVAIKFFPGGYGKINANHLEIPYYMWSNFFSNLTKLKLEGTIPKMQISVPSPWEFYLPLIEHDISISDAEIAWRFQSALREFTYSANRSIGDVAGVAELAISGNGYVYPSVLFVGEPSMLCGNVRTDTVTDIWFNSPVLNRIRNIELSDISETCNHCAIRTLCGGGSRARAYMHNGSFWDNDDSCPLIAHKSQNNPVTDFEFNSSAAMSREQKLLLTDTGDAIVTFIGDETSQFRVTRLSKGYEIRTQTKLIDCNEDMAVILDYLLNPKQSLLELSERIGVDSLQAKKLVHNSLEQLEKAGIPISIWDNKWQKI